MAPKKKQTVTLQQTVRIPIHYYECGGCGQPLTTLEERTTGFHDECAERIRGLRAE